MRGSMFYITVSMFCCLCQSGGASPSGIVDAREQGSSERPELTGNYLRERLPRPDWLQLLLL